MANVSGRIIKSSDIKIEGQFQLGLEKAETSTAGNNNNSNTIAEARVVESSVDFAVLEITCSCGSKTHVKCEFNNGHSVGEKPDTEKTGENQDEV